MLRLSNALLSALLSASSDEPQSAQAPEQTAEPAQDDGWLAPLRQALENGRVWLDLNYRYAFLDVEGFEKDAYASTLRTLLGYETAELHGFKGLIELENVSEIGPILFDSTMNGRTDRSVEPDPVATSVNQALVDWGGIDRTHVRLGREEIALDNHRWIGSVHWRQKHQTLEGVNLRSEIVEGLDVFYAYADQVNKVNRTSEDLNANLVNLAYEFADVGRLTAHGYYLDFDTAAQLSSMTAGLRFAGQRKLGAQNSLLYQAEFANQRDVGDKPADLDENYYLLNLGEKTGDFTVRLGGEVLGGDGAPGGAVQAPLSTLHAFNGWADRFLVTPDTGLRDYSLELGVPVGEVQLGAILHDFHADSGGEHYGSELDVIASWQFSEAATRALKAAYYDADEYSVDATKAWF